MTAPDLPGHGESPRPAVPMALADYAEAALAVLAEPALIVGHSMGAMIALDMAVRHPEMVPGVAALNAVFERDAAAAAAVEARAASLDGERAADPGPTLARWFGPDETPERHACGDWLRAVDPAGYRMAYAAFARAQGPAREALARLPCPVLFMTGALEPNSTPQMSDTMARLAPRGRVRIAAGAAHMMPMTHAGDVNAALIDLATEVLP